jgi:hypothetical protein
MIYIVIYELSQGKEVNPIILMVIDHVSKVLGIIQIFYSSF